MDALSRSVTSQLETLKRSSTTLSLSSGNGGSSAGARAAAILSGAQHRRLKAELGGSVSSLEARLTQCEQQLLGGDHCWISVRDTSIEAFENEVRAHSRRQLVSQSICPIDSLSISMHSSYALLLRLFLLSLSDADGSNASVGCEQGEMKLIVLRSGANLGEEMSVDYATVDQTATAGKDYTSTRGRLVFGPYVLAIPSRCAPLRAMPTCCTTPLRDSSACSRRRSGCCALTCVDIFAHLIDGLTGM